MNPNELKSEVSEFLPIKGLEDEVSFVNSLYPKLRYPTGEFVGLEEAEKCLEIARKIAGL